MIACNHIFISRERTCKVFIIEVPRGIEDGADAIVTFHLVQELLEFRAEDRE